jgi:hypothetical protein
MVEPIGVTGLVLCLATKAIGHPIDTKWSILAEKLFKTSADTSARLKSIERKIDNQIHAYMKSASISLENAASEEFSLEQKKLLIDSARKNYEHAYCAFGDVQEFGLSKAETAVYIAVCHFIEDRPKLAKKWFLTAKADYEQVAKSPLQSYSKAESVGNFLKDSDDQMYFQVTRGNLADRAGAIFFLIAASPVILVDALKPDVFCVQKVNKTDSRNKEIKLEKDSAKLALQAIQELEPDLDRL